MRVKLFWPAKNDALYGKALVFLGIEAAREFSQHSHDPFILWCEGFIRCISHQEEISEKVVKSNLKAAPPFLPFWFRHLPMLLCRVNVFLGSNANGLPKHSLAPFSSPLAPCLAYRGVPFSALFLIFVSSVFVVAPIINHNKNSSSHLNSIYALPGAVLRPVHVIQPSRWSRKYMMSSLILRWDEETEAQRLSGLPRRNLDS